MSRGTARNDLAFALFASICVVACGLCVAKRQAAPLCTTPVQTPAEPIQIVVEIKGPTEIPINVHAEPIEVTGKVSGEIPITVRHVGESIDWSKTVNPPTKPAGRSTSSCR